MSNGFPNREMVAYIKKEFPVGTRVRLLAMDDAQAPPVGTLGTVTAVDDVGHLLMSWDSGGSLSLLYGVDSFEKVPVMSDKVRDQVLAIRATGRTNMFDTNAV